MISKYVDKNQQRWVCCSEDGNRLWVDDAYSSQSQGTDRVRVRVSGSDLVGRWLRACRRAQQARCRPAQQAAQGCDFVLHDAVSSDRSCSLHCSVRLWCLNSEAKTRLEGGRGWTLASAGERST